MKVTLKRSNKIRNAGGYRSPVVKKKSMRITRKRK